MTIIGVAVVAGLSCGHASAAGILELYLCDAPLDADNVTAVYITINEVQCHLNDVWITCEELEDPQTYDLLDLTGSNFTLLGDFALPAGNYA